MIDDVVVPTTWQVQTVPLEPEQIADLAFEPIIFSTFPSFYKGSFTADKAEDTFIAMRGWSKGE